MRKWLVFWALLISIPLAWAANTQLSNLSASGAIAAGNLVYVVQSAGSGGVKATFTQVATFINSLFSQDCTVTSVGVVTCLKTNNVAFATSATTDTTNAANLSSGVLPLARIGTGAASHAVPVDVAGTTTWKVVPDCTDTGGNHINYTQSTDAFSCGTSSSGGGGTTVPAPGFVVNNWNTPWGYGVPAAGSSSAANTIYCTYGSITTKATLNALGTRITTLFSTGKLNLAIYANSGGRPAAFIVATTGDISTTSTGPVSAALTANKQLGPSGADGAADLFFCKNQDNATAAETAQSASSGSGPANIGSATLANVATSGSLVNAILCAGANCNGGSSTYASATWPASLAGSTWTDVIASTTGPWIAFQTASVP